MVAAFVVALLVYFPGRQTPIAFTLATGIGISHLQYRIDLLEDKAIHGRAFTEDDKRFLGNLYSCFAKGGGLTVVLRQSGQLMHRYLSRSGKDLLMTPRIFVHSQPVRDQMNVLTQRIMQDRKTSRMMRNTYAAGTFYMGDPRFVDSLVGLYLGRIVAVPNETADGNLTIHWRAECPWEWPSYTSLFRQYGDYHAQCFSLPNAKSLLFGSRYCLRLDDGLGGYLVTLGIAKPFLAYSEWTEELGVQK